MFFELRTLGLAWNHCVSRTVLCRETESSETDRKRARESKMDRLRGKETECVFALEQIISLGLTHALHKWEMMRRCPSHSFLAKFGASFTENGLNLCAIITTSSKHLQQGLGKMGIGLLRPRMVQTERPKGSSATERVSLIKMCFAQQRDD